MRARGCRQRGSKQRAYRRAPRSTACLASGHMIVWPRHSARVTRTPAATRASRGHMIVWPTSSRLVIVWPTSSRPRRAGTAATHVWRCAPRVATWSCGHVKPRHARRRRVVSPPRAARLPRMPKADRSSALVPARPGARPLPGHRGAPAAGQRAFAQLSGPAGWSAAGGPASRREAARPQQREARVFRCPVFRCPWPLPHAHRNIGGIARTRAPCEVSRLAIGPTQAAAGKQMGKRSEHCPGTPVYRPPGARSGAAAR
jgi:hypothetical protein